MTPSDSENQCPVCFATTDASDHFCRQCGSRLLPDAERRVLDAYVSAKLDRGLADRLKDKDLVALSLAKEGEETFKKRMAVYFGAATLILSLLGWVGYSSLRDFTRGYEQRVTVQLQPQMNKIQSALDTDRTALNQLQQSLPSLKKRVDDVGTYADAQKKRLEGQSGEVQNKVEQFEAAEKAAENSSVVLQRSIQRDQQQLDSLRQNTQQQMATLEASVDERSIRSAFPALGRRATFTYSDGYYDPSTKKPGELWVNVQLSPDAQLKKSITLADMQTLTTRLQAAHFRVFLGTVGMQDVYNYSLGRMALRGLANPGATSACFYLEAGNMNRATQLIEATKAVVDFPVSAPTFVERNRPNTGDATADKMIPLAGMDFQIFIGSDASHTLGH
jgi:hypothetical protein